MGMIGSGEREGNGEMVSGFRFKVEGSGQKGAKGGFQAGWDCFTGSFVWVS
jgi:hypothetical protein